MKWWNRLFWKVSVDTESYSKFTSEGTMARVTFKSRWHMTSYTFSLDAAEYVSFIANKQVETNKLFKKVKARM